MLSQEPILYLVGKGEVTEDIQTSALHVRTVLQGDLSDRSGKSVYRKDRLESFFSQKRSCMDLNESRATRMIRRVPATWRRFN